MLGLGHGAQPFSQSLLHLLEHWKGPGPAPEGPRAVSAPLGAPLGAHSWLVSQLPQSQAPTAPQSTWLTCAFLPWCAGYIAKRSGWLLACASACKGWTILVLSLQRSWQVWNSEKGAKPPAPLFLFTLLLLIWPLLISDLISSLGSGSQAKP